MYLQIGPMERDALRGGLTNHIYSTTLLYKNAFCKIFASTGPSSIQHMPGFFPARLNSHLLLDAKSLKYVACQRNLPKQRKTVVETRKPLSERECSPNK